jgi:hypothetical protein
VNSPQIANPQILHHKTKRTKYLFFPAFIAKLTKSWQQICLAEFFYLIKIQIRTFRYVFVRRKIKKLRICESFKSAKKLGTQITYLQIAKNIWSQNHKSANCHTCKRSANVTNFVSLQIHGFAICGTYLRTTLLFKFATVINHTISVVDTGGVP